MLRKKTKARLYLLLPLSMFLGLFASEVIREIPQESVSESYLTKAIADDAAAEWFAGRSAAITVSNPPLIDRVR